MHSVDADIKNVSTDEDIPLDRVNKFTIANVGSADVTFGFKDSVVVLHQGQSVGFESGANAWFMDNLKLKIRFLTLAEGDSHECTVMICKVIKPSNIFQDALK